MSDLKFLILHCTATPEGSPRSAEQIKREHMTPVAQGGRGWDRPGYSNLFLLDGTNHDFIVENKNLTVEPWERTWGARGVSMVTPYRNAANWVSMHYSYVGGIDKNGKPKDTRTPAQLVAMEAAIEEVLKWAPDILIGGHNQLDNKACPSFWVPRWLKQIGINDKNIYTPDPYGYSKLLK